MTAAYRLKGLGWFLSGVIVVLGFYLVSLQVAAERKKVEDVTRMMIAANREITSLDTEFETRANLLQLEKWNGEVLALSAPSATQFIPNEAELAQIDFTRPDEREAAIQVANHVVPSGPGLTIAPIAVAVQTAPIGLSADRPARADTPHAGSGVRPEPFRTILASVAPGSAGVGTSIRRASATQTIALLDRKLLSDSVIGDLVSGARAEVHGTR